MDSEIFQNTVLAPLKDAHESVYSFETVQIPWTNEERTAVKKIFEEIIKNEEFDLSPFYV